MANSSSKLVALDNKNPLQSVGADKLNLNNSHSLEGLLVLELNPPNPWALELALDNSNNKNLSLAEPAHLASASNPNNNSNQGSEGQL